MDRPRHVLSCEIRVDHAGLSNHVVVHGKVEAVALHAPDPDAAGMISTCFGEPVRGLEEGRDVGPGCEFGACCHLCRLGGGRESGSELGCSGLWLLDGNTGATIGLIS